MGLLIQKIKMLLLFQNLVSSLFFVAMPAF